MNLRSSRAAPLEQDVHDLAFPAAEAQMRVFFHSRLWCPSISGGLLHTIDNQEFARAPGSFEFQAKLLLNSGENGWTIGRIRRRDRETRREESGGSPIRRKFQMEIEQARDPGLVDNGAIEMKLPGELR